MTGPPGTITDACLWLETDVEFAPSHRISAQEAVDVAIAPVLDEAIVALSHSNTPISVTPGAPEDLNSPNLSGGTWTTSPGTATAASSSPGLANLAAVGSRSPSRSNSTTTRPIGLGSISRSFSPDSSSSPTSSSRGAGQQRATSPGSASGTSFSVGTPPDLAPDWPHGSQQQHRPFSQHLADALEKEKQATPHQTNKDNVSSSPQLKQGHAFDGTSSPNPNTLAGLFGAGMGSGSVGAPSASPGMLDGDFDGSGRGLSFTSYAGESRVAARCFSRDQKIVQY